MHLKLRNGDYVADGAGGFARTEGDERILEHALFQLSARRGGFSLLPEVGSRLYLLPREKPSEQEALARAYVQEALEPLGLTVTGVSVTRSDVLSVVATVSCQGENVALEVAVS